MVLLNTMKRVTLTLLKNFTIVHIGIHVFLYSYNYANKSTVCKPFKYYDLVINNSFEIQILL